MILDRLNTLSDAQLITTTVVSTDVIDLGPLGGGNTRRDIGQGEPVTIFSRIIATMTAAGGATLTAVLETSDDNTTYVPLITTAALAVATLVAGTTLIAQTVPRGVRRFLRMTYTVATGPMTAGSITTAIVDDYQDPTNTFASGFKLDT